MICLCHQICHITGLFQVASHICWDQYYCISELYSYTGLISSASQQQVDRQTLGQWTINTSRRSQEPTLPLVSSNSLAKCVKTIGWMLVNNIYYKLIHIYIDTDRDLISVTWKSLLCNFSLFLQPSIADVLSLAWWTSTVAWWDFVSIRWHQELVSCPLNNLNCVRTSAHQNRRAFFVLCSAAAAQLFSALCYCGCDKCLILFIEGYRLYFILKQSAVWTLFQVCDPAAPVWTGLQQLALPRWIYAAFSGSLLFCFYCM